MTPSAPIPKPGSGRNIFRSSGPTRCCWSSFSMPVSGCQYTFIQTGVLRRSTSAAVMARPKRGTSLMAVQSIWASGGTWKARNLAVGCRARTLKPCSRPCMKLASQLATASTSRPGCPRDRRWRISPGAPRAGRPFNPARVERLQHRRRRGRQPRSGTHNRLAGCRTPPVHGT